MPGDLLELQAVTKRYGPVTACDRVSFGVAAGELRAVLGQNGAGKSTVAKIIAGLVPADSGSIHIAGEPARIRSPAGAVNAGVGMVHQHFSLVAALPVWKNVILGDRGRLDPDGSARQIREVGERYGFEIDPFARVADLTPGERQRVEIVKCLRREPRILILDEPTSVLTLAESAALFDVLRQFAADFGRAVILISHRMQEILQAADSVTVLRAGAVVETVPAAGADATSLSRSMLGRELGEEVIERAVTDVGQHARVDAAAALRIEDVSLQAADGRVLLAGLDIEVHPGEIVGVAGVEGNGQGALVDLLSNLATPPRGKVFVDGEEVRVGRGNGLRRAGVAVVPADRQDASCVLDLSVADNLVLGSLDAVASGRWPVLSRRRIDARAAELIERFQIVAPGPDAPMRSLSGGNQQRVVLARELTREHKVLVVSQPTHGLDVGAMQEMWLQLLELAREGSAILLVSTELDEILALSTRIVVMHRGAIVGEMARDAVDLDRLGLLMSGEAA